MNERDKKTPLGCLLSVVASFLLAAALAAMGFAVELRALRKKGLRPLLLALSSALLIAGTSYGLLQLLR